MIDKYKRFLPVAQVFAEMSKDPSTKVGAVALDDKYNVVSTGWNGFPRGINDAAERYADRETKLRLVSHAEANLVAQAAYGGRVLGGTTVVVTHPPCANCAKLLIQSGVIRVVCPQAEGTFAERWATDMGYTRQMFKEVGVEFIEFDVTGD